MQGRARTSRNLKDIITAKTKNMVSLNDFYKAAYAGFRPRAPGNRYTSLTFNKMLLLPTVTKERSPEERRFLELRLANKDYDGIEKETCYQLH